MIVVSDTSPLTALLNIGEGQLLNGMFGDVLVPEAVSRELLRNHAALPTWLQVKRVNNTADVARVRHDCGLGRS